jgi:hypothetical protein
MITISLTPSQARHLVDLLTINAKDAVKNDEALSLQASLSILSQMENQVIITKHEDIDLSDAMIAERDPDCLGIFFHDDVTGHLCVYEVWDASGDFSD